MGKLGITTLPPTYVEKTLRELRWNVKISVENSGRGCASVLSWCYISCYIPGIGSCGRCCCGRCLIGRLLGSVIG